MTNPHPDGGLDAAIAGLDAFINTLIDQLAPTPATGNDDDGGRSLFQLLHTPHRVFDDTHLLTVLKSAVTLTNLTTHLIATATAACERAGVPARQHARHGADLLTNLALTPSAAHRYTRVGTAAVLLPATTRLQRLGAISIELTDAIGKGLTHIQRRTELTDDDRTRIEQQLLTQTTPATVANKARHIAIARTPGPGQPGAPTIPAAENTDLNDMTLTQNDEGRITATLDLDVLTGEELITALDPLTRPIPQPDGTPDPRPAPQRRADALGHVIRHYLHGYQRPTSGGVLPHVTLIRPPTTAFGQPTQPPSRPATEVDFLAFTGPISCHTADLITCDCTLDTAHLDHNGVPLDIGRSKRLFTPEIRKALGLRDQGCAFPGCGRPIAWCDAHHIHHWHADHGHTCLDNGVLLCRHHHTLIHHTDWQIYLGPDRHPWFIPPTDPKHPNRPPEHLRSHARRTLTTESAAA